MPTTPRTDPFGQMNFQVTIPGISDDGREIRVGFTEVSGLGISIDVIEYRNGAEPNTVRKIPGLAKFSNITLRRGVIGDPSLFRWIEGVVRAQPQRVDVRIDLLDESRTPVIRWIARRAWPCKWDAPALKAEGSDVAIESIELCHEGIELDD